MIKVLLILSGILIFSGCSVKDKKESFKEQNKVSEQKMPPQLLIENIGKLRFRRSYAVGPSEDRSEDEISREIEKERRGNPWAYSITDSLILKKIAHLGMTDKAYGLIRAKFTKNKFLNFEVTGSSSGKKLNCHFRRPVDSTKFNRYNLDIADGVLGATIEIGGFYGFGYEDIKYLLIDIIPGRFPEVVILNEYYIMNGDNSDIYIYEIKFN